MTNKYCFDVETDGLLDSVSKIHCVVFIVIVRMLKY